MSVKAKPDSWYFLCKSAIFPARFSRQVLSTRGAGHDQGTADGGQHQLEF